MQHKCPSFSLESSGMQHKENGPVFGDKKGLEARLRHPALRFISCRVPSLGLINPTRASRHGEDPTIELKQRAFLRRALRTYNHPTCRSWHLLHRITTRRTPNSVEHGGPGHLPPTKSPGPWCSNSHLKRASRKPSSSSHSSV